MDSKSKLLDIFFAFVEEDEEVVLQLVEQNFNVTPVIEKDFEKNITTAHIYLPVSQKESVLKRLPILQKEFIELQLISPKLWDIEIQFLHEHDWMNRWKQYFYTITVENKLQITPVWEKKHDTLTNLLIDPKMGFGTGQHATTYLCLQILCSQSLKGQKILDIGAGSGILGVSALLMGAGECLFIENDPLAAQSCQNTVEINKVESQSKIMINSIFDIQDKSILRGFDIICINIIAEIICDILKCPFIQEAPHLILSGILESKLEMVLLEVENLGFEVVTLHKRDQWRALFIKTN